MRVAIIGARGVPARYGGFDTVATELAPRLVSRGCDVTVYCQPRYSLPERPKVYGGVRLVYLPAVNKRSLENVSHEAVSAAHALPSGYDVIYVLGMRATALYALARSSRPALFFNTDGHDWQRRKWGPKARRYLRWSERLGVRLRPHGLIADSRAIAGYFRDTYGVSPAFIPYGAPTIARPDPSSVVARGLRPGEYLLAVCRIEPENNVDKIVEAYAMLDTDVPLVIVGDTNYRTEFSRRLHDLAPAGVVFTGFVFEPEQLNALFCHSLAYVHGHEVGGTNPSLLHAMAARCGILANDVVYNREVLGDAGRYWATAVSLRDRMQEAIDDRAAMVALGRAALTRVEEQYDWEDVADRYVALFRDAVAGGVKARCART